MKSEVKTFDGIVSKVRHEINDNEGGYLNLTGDRVKEVLDELEAAHQREVAELRECLKETMVIAIAEYHNNSCFKHVKCGEIERCKTCKVIRWRKALQYEGGAE